MQSQRYTIWQDTKRARRDVWEGKVSSLSDKVIRGCDQYHEKDIKEALKELIRFTRSTITIDVYWDDWAFKKKAKEIFGERLI